jgi:hypothetical protein
MCEKTKAENCFNTEGKYSEGIEILKRGVDRLYNEYLQWKASEKSRKRRAKKRLASVFIPIWLGVISLYFTITSTILKTDPFSIRNISLFLLFLLFLSFITVRFFKSPKEEV